MRASSISVLARPAKVHQVLTPLIFSRRRPVGVAIVVTPATSEPKSGSVTMIPTMASPDAILGSHRCFCSSVPPATMARVRISGRVSSEPPMPSEPQRQLLGGDHHAQVVGLAAGGEAAVLLGHREAEAAELGEPGDDLFGDVGIGAVDVLGDGPDLVGGEAAERVAAPCRTRRRGAPGRCRSGEGGGDRFEEGGERWASTKA